jgi:hypothetical protein
MLTEKCRRVGHPPEPLRCLHKLKGEREMKKFLPVALLILTVQCLPLFAKQATPNQSPPPAISLSIAGLENSIKTGPPIKVEATITNESNADVSLIFNAVEDRGGLDYSVSVKNEHSAVPPDTKFGRALKGLTNPALRTEETPVDGSIFFTDLKPRGQWTDTIEISKLFDLTQPGKYSIQLSRFDDVSHSYVKSNVVTITITP